ncbi:MAG TPA: polysaccharide biosynthesis tyrosine autokinase [Candidatus Eremiobacteraceae bacterium]|nr:polysaccharide biosynthesis tyrosine autokinase [Candidatus Eremiobacteraceae bacterium]
MFEDSKIVPRDSGSNGNIEIFSPHSSRVPAIELSPREPHLYDYLLILRKHQWLILSFLVAVVTIVTIATFRMKPVYNASAKIEIDRENTNILPFQGADSYDFMIDMDNYIETQSRILVSETLALQTIRSLGLAANSDASDAGNSEAIAMDSLKNQKLPPEVATFLGNLSVRRIPNTRLLEVSFESTDPRMAAEELNAHLDNYIQQNYKSRYEATAEASKWLQDELTELSYKVRHSEDARIEYERTNQIWNLDDKNEKSNPATERLSDLNRQLTDAQSESLKKQALFEFAKSGDVDAVPQLRESTVLQSLQARKADLSVQYTDAVNQFGPNYPKVLRLQAQLKEVDDQMARERKGIIAQLESEYREAKQHEDLLARALDQQKAEVNAMSEKMIQYNILKREAEANKSLYDSLQTKLKEAQISSGLKSSNIRVVDPAMVPVTPSRPAKTRNIALAFLVGLVGGIGLALLREYLDNTVKTPDDVETLARLPSLAVVPAFGEGTAATKRAGLFRASSNGHEKRVELVAQHLPKSQMSEAFRALRTALLLSQPDHPPQVILVTSALPREGKTTAAANLAVTLAQLGDKTVLLDADLRKPGVGRLLNLGSGKYAGLSSYLAGVSSLDLVTIPHPSIPNLAAIPTGPLPPNPADLLSSHRLSEAIAELRNKFKFIVIDSPPIMAATDAVVLSVQTDGVLLVVRSGETPKEAFTRTRDLLSSVKCHLLGVVLNAVDSGAPDYYYSYRYYPYSYGYGPQESLELGHDETPVPASAEHRTEHRTSAARSDADDSDKL